MKPFHFPDWSSGCGRSPGAARVPRPRILRAAGMELDCLSRIAARHAGRSSFRPRSWLPGGPHGRIAGLPERRQLFETAWDENTDPFTKTVAVTICGYATN